MRRRRALLDGAGESLAEVVDDEVSAQSHGPGHDAVAVARDRGRADRRRPALLKAADDRLREGGPAPGRATRPSWSAPWPRCRPRRAAPAKPRSRAGRGGAELPAHPGRALKSADPLVRRDQPDSVHQMRVAARRLRATLRSFRPILDASATAHLRDELRWLGQVLGAARDGEVLGRAPDRAARRGARGAGARAGPGQHHRALRPPQRSRPAGRRPRPGLPSLPRAARRARRDCWPSRR